MGEKYSRSVAWNASILTLLHRARVSHRAGVIHWQERSITLAKKGRRVGGVIDRSCQGSARARGRCNVHDCIDCNEHAIILHHYIATTHSITATTHAR